MGKLPESPIIGENGSTASPPSAGFQSAVAELNRRRTRSSQLGHVAATGEAARWTTLAIRIAEGLGFYKINLSDRAFLVFAKKWGKVTSSTRDAVSIRSGDLLHASLPRRQQIPLAGQSKLDNSELAALEPLFRLNDSPYKNRVQTLT